MREQSRRSHSAVQHTSVITLRIVFCKLLKTVSLSIFHVGEEEA